jgi:hypothetical protein
VGSPGPRNRLGPTALGHGIVGVLFGLFSSTFIIAVLLGASGFALGRVGHRRCMLGQATNGRVAMAGSVISGAAVVLGSFGALIVFTDALDYACPTLSMKLGTHVLVDRWRPCSQTCSSRALPLQHLGLRVSVLR